MANPSHSERLRAYAELLVRVGVNLMPGQKLVIRASTDARELVREVADVAYGLGCPYIEIVWSDEQVTRSRFLKGPEETYGIFNEHHANIINDLVQGGAATLSIASSDPRALEGVDHAKLAELNARMRKALRPAVELQMGDAIQWCVAAAASPGWARAVHPELPVKEAVARLWDDIFAATRVNAPDPVRAWRDHNARLKASVERLNERRYAALRFAGNGTELEVGLADGHLWAGGGSRSTSGAEFVANMPTEEVFTAPHSRRVNGTVKASMPLSYQGTLIDELTLTFQEGRVVSAAASRGQAALDAILAADDGARRLGEVALVPASSPIGATKTLFYNTLFDENAATHLALGKGYDFTVLNASGMSEEEKRAAGLNDSNTHVDFMIGSPTMSVDGVLQDGSTEALMRGGEWVN